MPDRRAPRALALLSVFMAASCVVYPHDAVRVPAVEGRLLRDGVPVAGATVRYSADATAEDCDPEQGRGFTGPDGGFRFEGARERAWVQLLPPFLCVHRRMICIDTPGGRHVRWTEGSRGLCAQPGRLDLVCDIAPARIDRDSACVPAGAYDRGER